MKYYYVSINDSTGCLALSDEEVMAYLAQGYTLQRRTPHLENNLYVTFGCRAGTMNMTNEIDLPIGVDGEDDLAMFAEDVVSDWINNAGKYADDGMTFDELIEVRLLDRYGKEKSI